MNKINVFAFVVGLFVMLVMTVAATSAAPAAQASKGDADRGEYVFALAGGCGCHTDSAGFLAGDQEGNAANITSDAETGIGDWTDEEIIDAIRLGVDRDGRRLARMPVEVFSQISDQDMYDMVAYLRTIPAIENEITDPDTSDLEEFELESDPPARAPTRGLARGEYIAQALAHCGDCHTPPNTAFMAGGPHPGFNFVPNITQDNDTGLGEWSEEEIAEFLQTGDKPDGTQIEPGPMLGIIKGSFSKWTDDDALAVAAYLKTVPAQTLGAPASADDESAQTLPQTGDAGNSVQTALVALALFAAMLLTMGVTLRMRVRRRGNR